MQMFVINSASQLCTNEYDEKQQQINMCVPYIGLMLYSI